MAIGMWGAVIISNVKSVTVTNKRKKVNVTKDKSRVLMIVNEEIKGGWNISTMGG